MRKLCGYRRILHKLANIFSKSVTIQNWRIDYHVSFPYLRAKLKT